MTPVELRRQEFLDALTRLGTWLGSEGIEYRIIGGLAVAAHIDEGRSLDFDRGGAANPTQRIPDVDLLVPRHRLTDVKSYAATARNGVPPFKVDTVAADVYVDFRPDREKSYLTHRQMMFPVPSRLFRSRTANLLGRPIETIDPRTLLHTFGTIGGVVRQKDVPKMIRLAEAIGSGRALSWQTERDCEVFGRFMLARKRQSPAFIAAKAGWEGALDVLPPKTAGRLSQRLSPAAQRVMGQMNRTGAQDGRGLGR
ncbi:hypothetical protein ACWGID_02445 [Kribbella sp. NPDC054772]